MASDAARATRSDSVVERVRNLEGTGLRTFMAGTPVVRERTSGSWIYDADGREYLDLHGGFAVAAVGYCHPRVTEAIQHQAAVMTHCPSATPSELRADLYERLINISPPGMDRVMLGITGASVNELAVQLARAHTGRETVIAFSGGYFGRSAGSVGYAGKHRYRSALGVSCDAQFLPFPDPYRSPWAGGGDPAAIVLGMLREMLDDPGSGVAPPACILVEPIQGNGGVVIPPVGFLTGLRELATDTGALLVFDEIQSGFGRSGRMWACQHEDVSPDILTIGKGIGGGLPIAAVLGSDEVMTTFKSDAVTSTFLSNALTQAAAIATIDVMVNERLDERSARLGDVALGRLREGLGAAPHVGDVRGLGLFVGIEVIHPGTEQRPDPTLAEGYVSRLKDEGLIVGRGGRHDNVLKLSPPLTIGEDELLPALDKLIEVLS